MKAIFQKQDSITAPLMKGNFVTPSNAVTFLDMQLPEALLTYFQDRRHIHYFALKPGKPKHVMSAERILKQEFNLNNETHSLPENFDWLDNPSRDLEWLIMLHKFYYSRDLALAYDYTGNERYAQKWVQLVDAWICQVPDGFVNSQVTGRRLQQWLLAYHYFVPGRSCKAISADFLNRLLGSIQSQAIFLSENLTPEGNHRTIELYAIFSVAVLFPELSESANLLAFAKHELLKNLLEDFLLDGVQKELSTDYHHTVLKNFMRVRELADLNGVAFPDEFDESLRKALDFSIHAHKPDGFLPAINDGDVNSYLSLLRKAYHYYPSEELLYTASQGETGQPPQQRSRVFPNSGYCVLRSDWANQPYRDGRYLFFDCGSLGFGSHGHYDLLSLEAAAFGRSLVVDPGRYTYHEDQGDQVNWRHAFKGTAAHNTVMVDGQDQITYRCQQPIGPEPSASLFAFVSMPDFDFVHGLALSPQYLVEHQRSIFFAEQDYWIITDLLSGSETHRYDQFFHLAPNALEETRLLGEMHGRGIISPNLLIVQPANTGIDIAIEQGWVSPEYGSKHPAPVIRFTQQCQGIACFQTILFPYCTTAPELRVSSVLVTSSERTFNAREAIALNIDIQLDDAVYQDCLFVAHEASDMTFSFADITCRAQVLFLRRDASGEVLSIQGVGLQQLTVGAHRLIDHLGMGVQLSYSKGRCHIANAERILEVEQPNLERLAEYLASVVAATGSLT